MKLKHVIAFMGVATPMFLSHAAQADFTGLSVELHSSMTINGTARKVYRVYANFTEGGDRLYLWGGGTANPVSIQSTVGNFFNPGGAGSNTAPSLEQIGNETTNSPSGIPNIRWGTFATIGVNIADQGVGELGGSFPNPGVGDLTQISPGFPTFIIGPQITFAGAVFLPGDLPGDAQNRADFAPDGDAALRVMMMQLTVNANSHVQGTIPSFIWKPEGSATTVMHPSVLTFTSVPGPGGLALVGVAVCLRSRRRDCLPIRSMKERHS